MMDARRTFGPDKNIVKVVSTMCFPSIPNNEIIDFPREPPADSDDSPMISQRPFSGRPRSDPPVVEYEVCLICGEQVVKGTMDQHIAECLADI